LDLIETFLTAAGRFVPMLATLAVVAVVLAFLNWFLRRRWQDHPDAQFRFQLIMLALTLAGAVLVIILLPINDTLRGQLLSLLGILLSAAIALSATTFIGNVMAGIMLKAVKKARPGDFITVADLTGRITEMDLLQTEIQTEFRDLVTVPNLHMVTQPLKVVRASGTIITSEVSLGYDVSRTVVADILCQAAMESGLKEPFVHVRELGDYSIVYRVAGLLEDVQSLISARSRLRECMLDALHAAEIEIVSPAFMNTRTVPAEQRFIPIPSQPLTAPEQGTAEQIAFDKADEAASVEGIKKEIEHIEIRLAELGRADDQASAATKEALEAQKAHLEERVEAAENALKTKEQMEIAPPKS
jgi:small-conductance mechanosensitive channel